MEYKSKVVDDKEVLFSSDWINDLEDEKHFNFYWHQAMIVYKYCVRNHRLLEIGVGSGLLSGLLKKRGWNIKTLDIDRDKQPDICGSAIDFNYNDFSANTILAFEIFEHIPFETFTKLVSKIGKSQTNNIVFSLPWNEIEILRFSIKLPKFAKKIIRFAIERGKVITHAHFWELAKRNIDFGNKQLVTFEQVLKILESNGFSTKRIKKVGYIEFFVATRVHAQ